MRVVSWAYPLFTVESHLMYFKWHRIATIEYLVNEIGLYINFLMIWYENQVSIIWRIELAQFDRWLQYCMIQFTV